MSVSNGQDADETTFNNAFVSKTTDSTVAANIDLNDSTDATQGTEVQQLQRELNSLNSFLGKTINTAKDVLPTWTNNNFGSSDDVKSRVDAMDGELSNVDNTADANKPIAGDVTGTLGASTVAAIQNVDVDTTAPTDGQVLKYINASAKWVPSAESGGGGGGSLTWIEDGAAPIPDVEYSDDVRLYLSGGSQNLYCAIRVPSSYAVGSPIAINLTWYSPDVTGTALLTGQSTLIRTGTDAYSSTTNQRTTTNSAVDLSTIGTADLLYSASLDITDSSGQINSVAVSSGDVIKVRLYRGSDTATSDIRALINSAEVTFT